MATTIHTQAIPTPFPSSPIQGGVQELVDSVVETPVILPSLSDPGGPIFGIKLYHWDELINGFDGGLYWPDVPYIMLTTDGINWFPFPAPDNKIFTTVIKIPSEALVPNYAMETVNGEIYFSPDGRNWTACDMSQLTSSGYTYLNLLSYTGRHLWATSAIDGGSPVNNFNALFRSEDGGETWILENQQNQFDNPQGFHGIVFGAGLRLLGV